MTEEKIKKIEKANEALEELARLDYILEVKEEYEWSYSDLDSFTERYERYRALKEDALIAIADFLQEIAYSEEGFNFRYEEVTKASQRLYEIDTYGVEQREEHMEALRKAAEYYGEL